MGLALYLVVLVVAVGGAAKGSTSTRASSWETAAGSAPFDGMYDCMHEVDDGATVIHTPQGHKIVRVDGSAYMVRPCRSNRTRLNAARRMFSGTPMAASTRPGTHGFDQQQQKGRFSPGWQAWYLWNTNTIWPITGFSGTWVVPEPPSSRASQLGIFPALQNLYTTPKGSPNGIIQPVIQYGRFASGGGHEWNICSWCVMMDGSVFYTPLARTSTGNVISGQMTLTQTNPEQKWTIVTTDMNTTQSRTLHVQQTYDELWALVAFEGYTIRNCADLPQSPSVTFSSLLLNTTAPSPPFVMWQGTQTSEQCGLSVDSFPSSSTELTIQF